MKAKTCSNWQPGDEPDRLGVPPRRPTPETNTVRRRRTQWLGSLISLGLTACLTAFGQGGAGGDQPHFFPLECGMSVATCQSYLPTGFVVGVVDSRNLNSAPFGTTNWFAPMHHNENGAPGHVWNQANLGQVFGVCIDDASPPNIYVSATTIWGSVPNPGRIHKLDGASGNISTFATIPGVGSASLGNVCYDKVTQQFFTSDLDTGLIHCLDASGTIIAAFDHGVQRATAVPPLVALPDTSGIHVQTQLGRLVWGLQTYQDRLYYAVINETLGSPSATLTNEIWSVQLQAGGGVFIPNTIRRENLVIPPQSGGASEAVTDIAFSDDGRMLIAERGHPHLARNFEYVLAAGIWTGTKIAVGSYSSFFPPAIHENSAGGVDYDCEKNIFSTGNALVLSGAGAIYGLQISPPGGDTSGSGIDQSHLVDLNADATANTAFKGGYGDIAVYRCCECLKITDERAECTALTNSFTWSFCVTNTGTLTNGHYVFIDLPPGVTVSPRIIDLNPLVLPGQGICTNVTFTIDPAFKTNELCFRLAAHTPDYATCCIVSKCVKVPECCAAIVKESLKCDPVTGQINWTFQIQNTSGSTVSYLIAVQEPPGCVSVIPPVITLVPPLPSGQSTNLTVTLSVTNSPCDQACFRLSLHDEKFRDCCSFLHCLRLRCNEPNHPPVIDCPDQALLECNPDKAVGYVIGTGVQDPDGDLLTVIWKVDGNPVKTNTIPAGVSAVSNPVQLVHTYPPGIHQITLCVSDGNGPPIVCNWTLEVGDKTPPTVKCPPDRIIEGVWEFQLPNLTGQVLVEDNCSVASQIKVTQEPPPGTLLGAGVHCIQFTIMDAAGNVTTCRTCIDVRPLVINGLYGAKPTEPIAPASFNLSVTGDLAGTMLVEYFVNGTSIGGGKGAGFQLKWSNVPTGSYEVVAEAFSRGIPTQAGRSRPAYVYIAPPTTTPRVGGFSRVVALDGQLHLTLETVAGEKCVLEMTDQMESGQWVVVNRMVGDGNVHTIRLNTDGTARFVRVRIE